jgi:hypothetical protein
MTNSAGALLCVLSGVAMFHHRLRRLENLSVFFSRYAVNDFRRVEIFWSIIFEVSLGRLVLLLFYTVRTVSKCKTHPKIHSGSILLVIVWGFTLFSSVVNSSGAAVRGTHYTCGYMCGVWFGFNKWSLCFCFFFCFWRKLIWWNITVHFLFSLRVNIRCFPSQILSMCNFSSLFIFFLLRMNSGLTVEKNYVLKCLGI